MLDVLAGNRDRALRYEQTYNLLNFENKLKGLEQRSDYPVEKPWYFRPDKDTFCDYNIISNYPMSEHHFQPPEKRPPPNENVSLRVLTFQKEKKYKSQAPARDFNIVTNKYTQLNDLKVATNDEIFRAEAAKKYWEHHDFDLLQIKYLNPDKEKKFIEERDAEAKIHGKDFCKKLPVTVQK